MNGWNSEKRNPDLCGLSHIVTNEGETSTSETEKEWLRRISETFPRHELEAIY